MSTFVRYCQQSNDFLDRDRHVARHLKTDACAPREIKFSLNKKPPSQVVSYKISSGGWTTVLAEYSPVLALARKPTTFWPVK